MFEIGQHVICIDNEHHKDKLLLNKVYTVKGTSHISNFNFTIPYKKCENIVFIEEVKNLSTYENSQDIGFATIRFKPLSKLTVDNFKDVSLPVNEVMKEFLEFAN